MQVRTFKHHKGYHIAPGVKTLPRAVWNSKYSSRGGYSASSFERFNLPRNVVDLLVSTSNTSLASSTWAKYNSTDKLVRKIEMLYFKRRAQYINRYHRASLYWDNLNSINVLRCHQPYFTWINNAY